MMIMTDASTAMASKAIAIGIRDLGKNLPLSVVFVEMRLSMMSINRRHQPIATSC